MHLWLVALYSTLHFCVSGGTVTYSSRDQYYSHKKCVQIRTISRLLTTVLLEGKISWGVVPVSNGPRDIRVVVGAAEVRHGAVVVVAEVPVGTARDVANEARTLLGLVVAIKFSSHKWTFGPGIAILESGPGLAIEVEVMHDFRPVIQVIRVVLLGTVVVVATAVRGGLIGVLDMGLPLVDVATSRLLAIKTASIVHDL